MNDKPEPQAVFDVPVASLPQSYWEMEHRRVTQYSDWLCKTFGFSRSGVIQGEVIPVKSLRKLVFIDKDG
jgi:hypothetical protein